MSNCVSDLKQGVMHLTRLDSDGTLSQSLLRRVWKYMKRNYFVSDDYIPILVTAIGEYEKLMSKDWAQPNATDTIDLLTTKTWLNTNTRLHESLLRNIDNDTDANYDKLNI